MAAGRYEVSLRVVEKHFTSERSERVKYIFNKRREISRFGISLMFIQ